LAGRLFGKGQSINKSPIQEGNRRYAMPDKQYRVIFWGKVAPGHTAEEVKRNLTSLFKLSAEKFDQLFSGKRFVAAKNVDYESAMKYKMAFETAGAICKLEELATESKLELVTEAEQIEVSGSDPVQRITCPKCGFEQVKSEECKRCGVIIRKYRENLETEEVTPHPTPLTPRRARQVYFSVSKLKLVVLCLVTLSLYEIYWFYKNWKLVKIKTGEKISPFWRAVFAIFFCYSLFKRVQDSASLQGCRSSISPGWLTVAYIILGATWQLPDPYWLIGLISFVPLLPVQGVINEINRKPASIPKEDTDYLMNVAWT
jgi:hypothetical protein